MTAKCANPLCTRPLLYFRSGKIYLIEGPALQAGTSPQNSRKEIEYFWLCGACAQNMNVTLDREGVVGCGTVGERAADRDLPWSKARDPRSDPSDLLKALIHRGTK